MAQLDEQFDATQTESNQAKFDVIPVGEYVAMIIDSDLKENSKGTGTYLKWDWMIAEGEYENRHVFEQTTWKHTNPKPEQIGRAQFGDICRACNVLAPSDTGELHQIPCIIKVAIERDASGQYPDKNVIKAYYRFNPETGQKYGTAPAAAVPTPAAPAATQAPRAQASAPARPLPATNTGKPAWQRPAQQPARAPA
jgi:hypothetical protein